MENQSSFRRDILEEIASTTANRILDPRLILESSSLKQSLDMVQGRLINKIQIEGMSEYFVSSSDSRKTRHCWLTIAPLDSARTGFAIPESAGCVGNLVAITDKETGQPVLFANIVVSNEHFEKIEKLVSRYSWGLRCSFCVTRKSEDRDNLQIVSLEVVGSPSKTNQSDRN